MDRQRLRNWKRCGIVPLRSRLRGAGLGHGRCAHRRPAAFHSRTARIIERNGPADVVATICSAGPQRCAGRKCRALPIRAAARLWNLPLWAIWGAGRQRGTAAPPEQGRPRPSARFLLTARCITRRAGRRGHAPPNQAKLRYIAGSVVALPEVDPPAAGAGTRRATPDEVVVERLGVLRR